MFYFSFLQFKGKINEKILNFKTIKIEKLK